VEQRVRTNSWLLKKTRSRVGMRRLKITNPEKTGKRTSTSKAWTQKRQAKEGKNLVKNKEGGENRNQPPGSRFLKEEDKRSNHYLSTLSGSLKRRRQDKWAETRNWPHGPRSLWFQKRREAANIFDSSWCIKRTLVCYIVKTGHWLVLSLCFQIKQKLKDWLSQYGEMLKFKLDCGKNLDSILRLIHYVLHLRFKFFFM